MTGEKHMPELRTESTDCAKQTFGRNLDIRILFKTGWKVEFTNLSVAILQQVFVIRNGEAQVNTSFNSFYSCSANS